MNRILLAVLLMTICFPSGGFRAEQTGDIKETVQEQKEQIGEVQKEIERSRVQIQTMKHDQRLILDRLDQMELQHQRLRERLQALKRERALVRQEVAEKRERLKQLSHDLKKLRSFLAKRLEALYKSGQQAYLTLLISVQKLSELQHNWVYLRAIDDLDSRLIREFQDRQREEEKLTQNLSLREMRLSELVSEIGQQKGEVEQVKRRQVSLLQDIHSKEATYQRYVTELAKVSQELKKRIGELQQQLIESKSEERRRKGGFANMKGALPYPVRGRVVSRFGPKQHEKFGTTIRNNGIHIATEQMSPVAAVYGGQVLFCERVKGYGEVVIIDHGNKYYTLTAHLGKATKEAGGRVEAGEVIGYAGYSPVDGKGGRVYFEIRHLGKALDPQAWLLPVLASATAPERQ